MDLLASIQRSLKAPKSNKNTFGGYNYRSCEDILEAVKPLLNGGVLTITDDIVMLGNRFYVKATATLSYKGESVSASAYARETESRKGMDDAQLTGATSSYARKYALNGLFCIDDTKDPDTYEKPAEGKIEDKKTAQKEDKIGNLINELIRMYPEAGDNYDRQKVADALKSVGRLEGVQGASGYAKYLYETIGIDKLR